MLLAKNVLRGILHHKTQFFALIALVFITVTGLFSLPISTSYLSEQKTQLEQDSNPSDIEYTASQISSWQYANYLTSPYGDAPLQPHTTQTSCWRPWAATDPITEKMSGVFNYNNGDPLFNGQVCSSWTMGGSQNIGYDLVPFFYKIITDLNSNGIKSTMSVEDNRNAYDSVTGYSYKVVGYNNYLDYKYDPTTKSVVFVPNEYNKSAIQKGESQPLINFRAPTYTDAMCSNVLNTSDPNWKSCYYINDLAFNQYWSSLYAAMVMGYSTYNNQPLTDLSTYMENLDLPILMQGRMPTASYEVAISPYFARYHHINIGDWWTIQGTKYLITGYATSSSYNYNQIDATTLTPNNKTTAILFTSSSFYSGQFGAVFGSQTYANRDLSINFKIYDKTQLNNAMSSINRSIDLFFQQSQNAGEKKTLVYDNLHFTNSGSWEFSSRRNFIVSAHDLFSVIIIGFIALITTISIIIIYITIKKEMSDDAKQIAIMKSFGYKNSEIANLYVVMPIVASVIGILLGLTMGVIGAIGIITFLNQFFNFILITPWSMTFINALFRDNWWIIVIIAIVPLIFASATSLIVANSLVRKRIPDLFALK